MIKDLADFGYTEADHSPLHHHCSDNLVDVVIDPPAILLICYTCRQYWQTGLLETVSYKSMTRLLSAADRLYRKEAA